MLFVCVCSTSLGSLRSVIFVGGPMFPKSEWKPLTHIGRLHDEELENAIERVYCGFIGEIEVLTFSSSRTGGASTGESCDLDTTTASPKMLLRGSDSTRLAS